MRNVNRLVLNSSPSPPNSRCNDTMEKQTYFIVFHPSRGVAQTFPTYKEAWEFVEAQLAAGKGVYAIEQVN